MKNVYKEIAFFETMNEMDRADRSVKKKAAYDRFKNLLKSKLFENTIFLYAAHFTRYLLPFIVIPYLTRILGVKTWGTLSIAQAFGLYMSMAIEFGFDLSATRQAAKFRNDKQLLSMLFASVCAIKLVISTICIGAAAIFFYMIAIFQENAYLFWFYVLYGIIQGLGVSWLFQGLERMRFVVSVDVFCRLASTICIFIFVKTPDDAWKVPFFHTLAVAVAVCVTMVSAYRIVRFYVPGKNEIFWGVRMGFQLFLHRALASLVTLLNPLILGFLATPQSVGYYSGAEKLINGSRQLLLPAFQAFFPRMSHLTEKSPRQALREFKIILLVFGIAGSIVSLLAFALAPQIVRIVLGEEFSKSSGILRIMSIIPMVSAISTSIGTQFIMPLGRESFLNIILFGGAALNISLAIMLVPAYDFVGMAVSTTASFSFLSLASVVFYFWKRKEFLASRSKRGTE